MGLRHLLMVFFCFFFVCVVLVLRYLKRVVVKQIKLLKQETFIWSTFIEKVVKGFIGTFRHDKYNQNYKAKVERSF